MLHLQIAHGATFSLFRLALYCLRAMRIPAPFLNFLFWGEPLHMHYSGKWLEYAPLQPTEVLLYMYTVRPSLAVVWSKKIGMYLPSGFFPKKKWPQSISCPTCSRLYTSSMLGFATNIPMAMLSDACVLNHGFYKPIFYTTFNSFIAWLRM